MQRLQFILFSILSFALLQNLKAIESCEELLSCTEVKVMGSLLESKKQDLLELQEIQEGLDEAHEIIELQINRNDEKELINIEESLELKLAQEVQSQAGLIEQGLQSAAFIGSLLLVKRALKTKRGLKFKSSVRKKTPKSIRTFGKFITVSAIPVVIGSAGVAAWRYFKIETDKERLQKLIKKLGQIKDQTSQIAELEEEIEGLEICHGLGLENLSEGELNENGKLTCSDSH